MDGGSFALPKALRPTKKGDAKNEEPKKESLNDGSTKTKLDVKVTGSAKKGPVPDPKVDDKSPQNLTTKPCTDADDASDLKAPEKLAKPADPAAESKPENPPKVEEKRKVEPEVAVLQYKEPKWSGPAAFPYTLEVLKSGKILEEVDISESCFVTVGRLPSCDVPCLHPSISRYHAVFQHKPADGDTAGAVFLYDLGSSYGTTINKVKISPRTYYMLKTGYVIKFGASTRLYIVKGPLEEAFEDEEDMVPEPADIKDASVENKINKLGILASEEAEIMLNMLKSRETDIDLSAEKETEGGVSWGFREDAPEEEDGELKLDLTLMSRPADFKDPKKTLRGFFEREGVELEYVVTEKGVGKHHQYICKVELPIDTPNPVYAEGTTSGKKRDAVLACALHGCRLLDAYGVLRSSRKNEDIETRKQRLEKNDFYDSDEDTFLDRTGEVEHRRKRRMLRAGVQDGIQKSRSHDMLSEELHQANEEIARIQKTISESKASQEQEAEQDSLDSFMASVSDTTVTSGALKEMKKRLHDLKQSRVKLEKLCEMSKPIALPEVKRLSALPSNVTTGKVGKVSKPTPSSTTLPVQTKTLQPSKKIKINMSLKSRQPTENTEKPGTILPISEQNSDSTASEGADQESGFSSEKFTEITEFSAETEPEVIDTGVSEPRDNTPDSSNNIAADSTARSPKQFKKPPKKKAKKPVPQNPTLLDNVNWDDDVNDENFVNWTPPVGQSGDGKTKLNDKFGY